MTYLYPENYVFPAPTQPAVDPARDFDHALSLIRSAVPPEGPPLTVSVLVAIVCGYFPKAYTQTLSVDDDPAQVLAAARAGVRDIRVFPSVRTAHIRRTEAQELVEQVIEERSPTWTYEDDEG
jgi:hypothetical protein